MGIKESLFDISTEQRIIKQLDRQDFSRDKLVYNLILEVDHYLEAIELDDVHALEQRKDQVIDSEETYKFFRSRERLNKLKLTIQYLTSFNLKLPLESDIKEDLVDPFLQFKTFVYFLVNQLKEEDVIKAVLREHERLGLLTEKNSWYYRGRIGKSFDELIAILETANQPTLRDYRKIFEALNQLSMFWFSVRGEDISRVRQTDIYIYQLTRILLEKIDKT